MSYTEFMSKYRLNYEIVKLRHEGRTLQEIGDQYHLCASGVANKYRKFLFRLFRCYGEFLDSNGIGNACEILEFYVDVAVAIAYMEQVYDDFLRIFRHGKPPLLSGFYTNIPPFRDLTEGQLKVLERKILEAKDQQNETYADMADTLNLTADKVKTIYHSYYHRKCLKAIKRIEPTVDYSFSDYIFSYSHYPQVRWQLIIEEYADLIRDLTD